MTTGHNPFHYDAQPYNTSQPYGAGPAATGEPEPAGPAGTWAPFPDTQPVGAAGWPDALRSSTPTTIAGPPAAWLLGAAAAGLVGGVVAGFWGDALLVALLAWVAAGPVGVGLIGQYSRVDTLRRTGSVYTSPLWAPVLYWGAVVVVAVGIGLSAWRIADLVGRL